MKMDSSHDLDAERGSDGWHPFTNGSQIGHRGCAGIVLRDEEHDHGAHITLEDCGNHCEIVCGDYGGMMHTAFASHGEAGCVYEVMRRELGEFVSSDHSDEGRKDFYEQFTSKW